MTNVFMRDYAPQSFEHDYVYLTRGRIRRRFCGPRRLTAAGWFWTLYCAVMPWLVYGVYAAGVVLKAAGRQ